MTTDQTLPTEHASETYEGTSEEFFDPSNQAHQSDIDLFHVAERELGYDPDEIEQTTTIDRFESNNSSVDTDIEPGVEQFNQPSSPDQAEYSVTFANNIDTITSPAPTFVQSNVSTESPSTPLTTTIAIPSSTSPQRRIKKIQTTPAPASQKQNANEILQRLLDDQYIRTPMAALIDTSAESLRKSKLLWKAALRPQAPLDIVLVAYNSTGM